MEVSCRAETGDVSGADLRTAVWRALREVEALKVENEHLRQSLGGATDADTLSAAEAEPSSATGIPCVHQHEHEQQRAASTSCASRQRFCTVGGFHSPAMSPHQRATTSGVPRFSRLSATTGGAGSPAPSSARCLGAGSYTSFGGCPALNELPELLVEVAAAEAAAGAAGSLAAFRRSAFRRRSAATGTSSGGGSFSSRGVSRRNSSRRIPLPPFVDGLAEHTAAQRQQVLYEVASPFSSYAAAAAVDDTDDEADTEGAASPASSPSHEADAATGSDAAMARRLTMGSRRWLPGASSGAMTCSSRAPSATGLLLHQTPLSRAASGLDMTAVAAPVFAAYSCVESELVGSAEGHAAAAPAAARCSSGASGFLEGDEPCASPYYGSEDEEDEEEAYGWLYSSEDEEETWSSRTSRAAAAGKKGAGGAKAGRSSSSSGGGGDGRSGWFARWLNAMGVGLSPVTKAPARASGAGPDASWFPSPGAPAVEPAAASDDGRVRPAGVAAPRVATANAAAVAFVEMPPCNGVSGQQMARPPSSSRLGQTAKYAETVAVGVEAAAAADAAQLLEGDSSRAWARSRFSWRR
ncbi:hypothetical protein HXX76_004280 [Chlamydomonas incerta]|uniref:Uncharacterized protein n=1 Tax=Chlamydomonas incerta TaxID=51695 RepID=A0A835T754_CHLIN|nr:hypothetical protein HXX76_004280 [Chlamydomonas incerta]|eukprot:KAG2440167.1 hypothetical protein HXX76_004280 [Chlamydomonas incerta]